MKTSFFPILPFLLISLFKPLTCLSAQGEKIVVRIAIADDREEVQLALKGKYKMYDINLNKIIMEGPYMNAKVRATKDAGLQFGKKEIKSDGVKIKVARDSNIYVDNRRFRGDIDIIRKENSKLMVINHIGLDDYLYGVLYHEVSHRWPIESIKAQAIAARTFALYQALQNRNKPYDLRSDIYSQVYGGRTSEKWSTTRAVNLTKGKVLAHNGELLPAYYHATCGGHTEDASNLWKIDLPPLDGVRCNFCVHSPHYKWVKEIPLWKVEKNLSDNGYKTGSISSCRIVSRNKFGRVDKLQIKDDTGMSVLLTGKDFRQIIGPNDIRSTKFEAAVKRGNLVVEGFGWGHGVGMCQWGAFGMSRRGKRAEEILKFYYPGAEITSIDKV